MAYHQIRGNSLRVFVNCGKDSEGKKVIKSQNHKIPEGLSKKELERWIKEKELEMDHRVKGGSNVQNAKMKFKDFVSGIYETNHLSTLKPKTADGYRLVIKYRLLDYFGEMQLQDITTLDVRNWLSQLERIEIKRKKKDDKDKKEDDADKDADKEVVKKPLSENSKGNWFRTLSAIMGKAEEWELIEANPCKKIKQPRKAQSEVKALSQEDVNKVWAGLEKYEDTRIVILMKILILTGIRSSECAGLEWRDINFDDCSIKIERETIRRDHIGFIDTTPKSMSSQRVIAIPESLRDDLRAYQAYQKEEIDKRGDLWIGEKGDRCKLFTQFNGNPVQNSTFRFWVQTYMKWCGVPYVTVHGLRHTFASIMIANGVDARTTAAQMGHSQPSLVYNTYANPQEFAKRKAANLMGNIVTKKEEPKGSNENQEVEPIQSRG